MLPLYEINGLMFWTEEEIKLRNMIAEYFVTRLKDCLLEQNRVFQFFQCEAPLLMPRSFVNSNYTEQDIFVTQVNDLVLRPETTPSSYQYALHLLNPHNDLKVKMPFVVWQHGKSARYEQDLTIKNMRLKEFYQLEFQILFSETTRNDYFPVVAEAMCAAASLMLGDCRLECSERLPTYSSETIDIVCNKNNMEVCSVSRRGDFPSTSELVRVIEVAFGTDRCVYNFTKKTN